MNRIKVSILVITLLFSVGMFHTETISTNKKDYKAANTNEVSTRELAMLSSLVYEDVPNDSNYSPTSKSAGIDLYDF